MLSGVYDWIRTNIQLLAINGIISETFQYAFVINSLLSVLLIGPLLGGVGTMVITKRMAFFSEAIGHAALTGVSIGIILGESYTSPYISLFGFCILFAVFMNFTKNRTKMSTDTMIGVFLSISLAVGSALLIFVASRINVHILDNILFGSILTVQDNDITILLFITVAVAIVSLLYYNKMLLASFNTNLALVRGVNVKLLDYVFIVMVTVITVASVKIIGAILVEALLLIPAASARNLSKSMKGFFFYSVLFSTFSCVLGIIIPIEFDIAIPSGSAIIIFATMIFFITIIINTINKKRHGGV